MGELHEKISRSTHHLPEHSEAPFLRLGARTATGPEEETRDGTWEMAGEMSEKVG